MQINSLNSKAKENTYFVAGELELESFGSKVHLKQVLFKVLLLYFLQIRKSSQVNCKLISIIKVSTRNGIFSSPYRAFSKVDSSIISSSPTSS